MGWSPVQKSYRLCIDYGTEKPVKAHRGCRSMEEEEELLDSSLI
jgi:hypothetical protein